MQAMGPFRARVHNGRLVLDEPTALPEGEIVELLPVGESSDAEEGFVPAERPMPAGTRRFAPIAYRPGALKRFLDERR
jgi:hypothetical protein